MDDLEHYMIYSGLNQWMYNEIHKNHYFDYLNSFDKTQVNVIFELLKKEINAELPNVYLFNFEIDYDILTSSHVINFKFKIFNESDEQMQTILGLLRLKGLI